MTAAARPDTQVRDRLRAIAKQPRVPIAEIGRRSGASGWVVESVPLALVAAERVDPDDVMAIMRTIVQIGGDTDTIASIAGQVVGARLGAQGLPAPTRRIQGWAEMEPVVLEFAEAVNLRSALRP